MVLGPFNHRRCTYMKYIKSGRELKGAHANEETLASSASAVLVPAHSAEVPSCLLSDPPGNPNCHHQTRPHFQYIYLAVSLFHSYFKIEDLN